MNSQSDYERAVLKAEQKLRFYTHSIVYVLVNAMLIAINLLNNPQKIWFYWPLAGWGIGLALHAMQVFLGTADSSFKQRLIQHELEKEQSGSTHSQTNLASNKDSHKSLE